MTKKAYIIWMMCLTVFGAIGLFIAIFGTYFNFNKIICFAGLVGFMLGGFGLAIVPGYRFKNAK